MKFVIVAGTPHCGKTSLLLHALPILKQHNFNPSIAKIDCIWTDDDRRYSKMGVPIKVGIAGDMCPDHFSIYNTESLLDWSKSINSDLLLTESAGLCLRCSPYITSCLAVCVVDMTGGPYSPDKIGPLLTTADIIVMTKGDMISQAEREIFHEKIYQNNKKARIVEANGLTGQGTALLAKMIMECPDLTRPLTLRHTPPLAVCTLCTGERRVERKYHFGVLRNMEGVSEYEGE